MNYYRFGRSVSFFYNEWAFLKRSWNRSLLMRKGWISEKQWLRLLYIDCFSKIIKKHNKLTQKINILRLKTVKALSPIKHNKPGGRRK